MSTRHPSGPRTLCVLVPAWPLDVARRAGRLPGGPTAVYRDGRIVAASREAGEEGVRTGQKRREAEAACPSLVTAESDPGEEAAAFEPVVLAIEALVPRVEVAEPGLAWVSARGALRYYGGAMATARAVLDAARSAGAPTARVGLARGPFAARHAALHAPDDDPLLVLEPAGESAFVASLPIAALDDPDLAGALLRLGIRTLGDLAALPRGAVAARFGATGLTAHRLALGEDRLPAPRPPREDLAVEVSFDDPLVDLEHVAFAARSLAVRFSATLSDHGLGAFAVEVSSGGLSRTWRSLDPLDERAVADRARWQVAAWSEAGLLPRGLAALRLVPLDVTGTGRQLSLFSDAAEEREAARAYARIQALLGPDAVRRAVLQGGRGPGDKHRWVRHGEPDSDPPDDRPLDAPWPGRLPSPSPALVLPEAVAVDVRVDAGVPSLLAGEEIISRTGPWRLREAWWDAARERHLEWWQVVTPSGVRLLARTRGGWSLHAIYD